MPDEHGKLTLEEYFQHFPDTKHFIESLPETSISTTAEGADLEAKLRKIQAAMTETDEPRAPRDERLRIAGIARDERLLSDAEVRRIAAVHYPHHCNGLSWCGSCLQDWPCHTIRFVRDRAALIEQLAAAEGRAAAEDAEDLAAAESVKGEPLIPWETVKAEIDAAEGRAQDVQISDTQRALEVLYQIHQDNGRGYCDICSERHPCSTIMEVDDLATENARLRAALVEVYAYHQQDAPLYPSDSSWETVRETLGGDAQEEAHSLRVRPTSETWHNRYVQRVKGE